MSADTVLTDEEMLQAVLANETLQYHFALNGGSGPVSKKGKKVFRAIEQAVLQSSEPILLKLLLDIRYASGDNGLRMQPELVEYMREMKKDAERYRWLKERNGGPIGIVAWHRDEEKEMVLVESCADEAIDAAMEKHP